MRCSSRRRRRDPRRARRCRRRSDRGGGVMSSAACGSHALPVVQIEEHRRALRHGAEQIAEPAEDVRPDRVALVLRQVGAHRALAGEDVEVVEPEVDEHFLELARRVDGAQDLLLAELVHRDADGRRAARGGARARPDPCSPARPRRRPACRRHPSCWRGARAAAARSSVRRSPTNRARASGIRRAGRGPRRRIGARGAAARRGSDRGRARGRAPRPRRGRRTRCGRGRATIAASSSAAGRACGTVLAGASRSTPATKGTAVARNADETMGMLLDLLGPSRSWTASATQG